MVTTQGKGHASRHEDPVPQPNTQLVPSSRPLGEILRQAGLITEAQLQDALRTQQELGSYKPVGQILVDRRIITREQLDLFLDRYHKWPRLGEILVKTKVVTKEQLEIALAHQKKTGHRLGETIVELNYATEEAMRQALCTQLNVTFIEVDKIAIDHNLTRLINKNYAKEHLVIPFAKIGDILSLAMDDPTDIAVIKELQALTGLQINVATSTRAAFDRGLARFYGKEPSGE